MASDTFKTLFFGLILFVLFSSLILTVAIDFGEDNGKDIAEIGGGSLNATIFQESIDDIDTSAEGYRTRFETGDVDDVDDPSSLFSVVTDTISMITTPFKLLSQVLSNILKVPTIFVNVLLGLLSIGLILAIWSVLRKGD